MSFWHDARNGWLHANAAQKEAIIMKALTTATTTATAARKTLSIRTNLKVGLWSTNVPVDVPPSPLANTLVG